MRGIRKKKERKMEENRQVGLEVSDELVEQVAVQVEKKMAKKEDSTSPKMFSDPTLQDKFENAYKIWQNNGYENAVDQYDATKRDQKIGYAELCDALSTPDASILIPKVISNIVKEAIEPLLVGTSLLQTIRFSAGQQITFPAAGAFTAEDIPEGGELNYSDSSPRMATSYNKNSSELRETPKSSKYNYVLVKILEIGQSAANSTTGEVQRLSEEL